MKLFTLSQAAIRLGLSPVRVRQLARMGILRAQKVGDRWLVTERELARFAQIERKVGRPSK